MINTVSKDGNSVNSFHMRQSSMVRLLAIILEGEQHMAVDVWRPTKSIASKRGRLGSGQRRSERESSQFLNHVSGAGGSCAHDHWDPCRVANPNIHFGIMCSQSDILRLIETLFFRYVNITFKSFTFLAWNLCQKGKKGEHLAKVVLES